MRAVPRRSFVKAAGVGVATTVARSAFAGAADRVVVGVIGPGGMGSHHVKQLLKNDGVAIAAVCDVDSKRLGVAAELIHKQNGTSPKAVSDLRQLLDDKSIDAVFIATPDHWHTPAALLALEAGKHVYVEKPCSHNIREGRLLVEGAARSGKHVQVGTQSRSTECVREAIERVQRGEIGEVLVSKAWNSQLRKSIGKTKPSKPPANLDYDMWLGPAPAVAYRSNMLPGIWRWWHAFGCGDMGNDGVHDIDVACWGLGVSTQPSRIACLGGKSFFDDDQQFPDTQYAVFEYPGSSKTGKAKQLIFEQRIWSPYVQEDYENGAAFYGTKGMLVIGHSVGWKMYGERNRLLAQRKGNADLPAHHANFLACVRGSAKSTNASPLAGHLSASLVHLGNIAARVGKTLEFDPKTETISNHAEAAKLVTREYRKGHWAVPKGA